MADLTLRTVKGSPLSIQEVDDNFLALDSDITFLTANSSTDWSAITGTPTTLSGYGITDAVSTATVFGGDVSGTAASIAVSDNSHNHLWSNITSTPTTLSGYGITDAGAATPAGTTTSSSLRWNGSAWVENTGVLMSLTSVLTDNIAEKTAAAGVTVDGVLIKDGLVDGKDVSTLSNISFAYVQAEENAVLTVGRVFSFGNGATGWASGEGYTVMVPSGYTATLESISFCGGTTNDGASTVAVEVNGTSRGTITVTTPSYTGTATITPFTLSDGDTINFNCTSNTSTTSLRNIVGALIKFTET